MPPTGDNVVVLTRVTRIYAHASFMSGVTRTLDLFGSFDEYNMAATPEDADQRALASDFAVVGAELASAMMSHAPALGR